METLIIHIKEKKDVITIKSLLSKMKSVALIEDSYTSFEQGTYKTGEKPSDFVTPDPDIDRTKLLQELKETRKKSVETKMILIDSNILFLYIKRDGIVIDELTKIGFDKLKSISKNISYFWRIIFNDFVATVRRLE